MGNSIFPKALDLDSNLYRVGGIDALIPDHHNNHTDAIETIEATIGVTADGSENGGTQSLLTGLAHFVNFPATSIYNPRYPVLPVPANAWYGSARLKPAAWTLGVGVSAVYTQPPGVLRLQVPLGSSFLLASCPLGYSDTNLAIFRIRMPIQLAAGTVMLFGLSVNGLGTDIDGIVIRQSAAGAQAIRTVINGSAQTQDYNCYSPWLNCKLYADGANIYISLSADGVLWSLPVYTAARAVSHTKFCIFTGTAYGVLDHFHVDFITFGHGDLPTT